MPASAKFDQYALAFVAAVAALLPLAGCGKNGLAPRTGKSITPDGRCTQAFATAYETLRQSLESVREGGDPGANATVAKQCKEFYDKHPADIRCKAIDERSGTIIVARNSVFKSKCEAAERNELIKAAPTSVAPVTTSKTLAYAKPYSTRTRVDLNEPAPIRTIPPQVKADTDPIDIESEPVADGGGVEGPVPEVIPAPPNTAPNTLAGAVDAKGNCTVDYFRIYRKAAIQVNEAGKHMSLNQVPENLAEAVAACDVLETRYSGVVCYAGWNVNQEIQSAAFGEKCAALRALKAKARTGPVPGNGGPPALAEVDPARASIRVIKGAELQKLIEPPLTNFAIDGKIYSTKDMITIEAPIRCSMNRPREKSVTFKDGEILPVHAIDELPRSGKYASIATGEGDLTLECWKKSEERFTVSDLQKALVGIIEFTVK